MQYYNIIAMKLNLESEYKIEHARLQHELKTRKHIWGRTCKITTKLIWN